MAELPIINLISS